MARLTLEQRLAALEALRDDPHAPAAKAELAKTLTLKSSYAVAKAATIIGEAEVGGFTQKLIDAFERFMSEPVKADPGCRAKTAIAEALYRAGTEVEGDVIGERVFHPGVRHVQLEAVYGGKVDTATELRGHCAMGLVRANDPDVVMVLADLLADSEAQGRAAACRALAYSGRPEALALLRYKAKAGDPDAEVLLETFTGLLQVGGEAQATFVAGLLDSRDVERATTAAMALGQSRLAAGARLLIDCYEDTLDSTLRETCLLALATHRSDRAMQFLLEVIAEAPAVRGVAAVKALGLYGHDPTVARRVREAAAKREDDALGVVIEEQFGGGAT